MSRMYVVQFGGVAVTAQQDFFAIVPAANKPIQVHALFLGQSTDAGDAEDEMLRIGVIRGHTSAGSGGGTFTPVAEPNNTAAGFTARINDTTVASGGTGVTIHADTFNVRAGYPLILTPEMRRMWRLSSVTANNRLVVRLLKTPADSLTMSGTLYVEELS